jgi:hypothetical protein
MNGETEINIKKRRRRHRKAKPEENNMNATQPYVIEPAPAPRQTIAALNGGANRGARGNIRAYADFNRTSTRAVIEPIYVDPLPGRAEALKDEALLQGIVARSIEGRLEDIVLARDASANEPVILNLDRASAIAKVLSDTRASGRTTLGYLLLKLPSGRLWGIRFVLEPHDAEARAAAIAFFVRLAEVSERNRSEAILGEGADPAHTLLEPKIRQWFAEHTTANLAKILAGVEPASNTFEITDGDTTRALVIVASETWSDPLELAGRVVANPSVPIRKGTQFVVAEVTRDGIRFHDVRRRTDDRVTVGGAEVADRAAFEAKARADDEAKQREEDRRRAEEALARAQRETLSRRNPVLTTD